MLHGLEQKDDPRTVRLGKGPLQQERQQSTEEIRDLPLRSTNAALGMAPKAVDL